MHAERHALHRLGEGDVGGRVERRVTAEHDEHLDPSRRHVVDQRLQGGELVLRAHLDGGDVGDGVPDVAEGGVGEMRQRLDLGRLRLAGHHQAASPVAAEVGRHGLDPARRHLIGGRRGRPRNADGRGERAGERGDGGGAEAEAVVRLRTGRGESALDDVETVHRLTGPPAARELAHLDEMRRATAEEVRVEGDDHVGAGQVVNRTHVVPEGCERPAPDRVGPGGLPLVPARFRVLLEDGAELGAEGGRGDGLGEEPQARAALPALRAERRARGAEEVGPGADGAAEGDGLQSLGVVERQYRRLGVGVRRAEARRMARVPLHLDRPSEMALDQEPEAQTPGGRHRGREVERPARDDALRGVHVGHDRLRGTLAAAPETAESERRGHQLQERASPHRVEPECRGGGHLAREQLLECRRVGDLLEGAPVLLAAGGGQSGADGVEVRHRWQT